jgi:RND family efflux transporter MFP subunit
VVRRLVVGAILAAGGGWLLRHRHHTPPPPRAANAAPAARPQAPARPEAMLGVVIVPEGVSITAPGAFRVEQVLVRIGDAVKRGDVLARLDSRSVSRDLAMAEAALQSALAVADRTARELLQARDTHRRLRGMARYTPPEQLATAANDVAARQAGLAAARATTTERGSRVDQLREILGDLAVRAPVDGVVARRYAEVGAVANPGTALFDLQGAGAPLLRFAAPPALASRLVVGAAVEAAVETVPGRVAAVVEKIAPDVDAASRLVFVEARLAAPRPGLRAGLVAHVFVAEAG